MNETRYLREWDIQTILDNNKEHKFHLQQENWPTQQNCLW
jgi:hypothetical protein